jgi:hypothetical protein
MIEILKWKTELGPDSIQYLFFSDFKFLFAVSFGGEVNKHKWNYPELHDTAGSFWMTAENPEELKAKYL